MITEELRGYSARHCLCIGIDDYEHWPKLRNAVHDAEGAAAAFDELGFEVSVIRNAEATRVRLASAIQDDLRGGVGPDDLVVVFFAGHGYTHRLHQKQKGYLVPVDAGRDRLAELISMDELSDWTDYIPSRHILYVFDSCFSGMATLRADPGRVARDLLARGARIVVTAGGADQTVVDGGWGDHSVFTGQLLLGLMGEAAGPDGNVTGLSLAHYLQTSVPRNAPQTPGLGVLPGHEGGDVLLRSGEGDRTPPLGTVGQAIPGSTSPEREGPLSRARHYLAQVVSPRLFRPILGAATVTAALGGFAWWAISTTNRPEPPPPTSPVATITPSPIYFEERIDFSESYRRDPLRAVIRSRPEWNRMWQRLTADRPSIPPLPSVDFSNSMILVVSGEPMYFGDELTVDSVRVGTPSADGSETMHVWVGLFEACLPDDPARIWPVTVVRVPRSEARVVWHEIREASGRCPGEGD